MFYTVFFYSLFIITGGVVGFRAGSVISLIMGLFFGTTLLISSFAIHKQKSWGLPLALIATLILDTVFTYRFFISFQLIPSGLFAITSLIVLIALIKKCIVLKNKQNIVKYY